MTVMKKERTTTSSGSLLRQPLTARFNAGCYVAINRLYNEPQGGSRRHAEGKNTRVQSCTMNPRAEPSYLMYALGPGAVSFFIFWSYPLLQQPFLGCFFSPVGLRHTALTTYPIDKCITRKRQLLSLYKRVLPKCCPLASP